MSAKKSFHNNASDSLGQKNVAGCEQVQINKTRVIGDHKCKFILDSHFLTFSTLELAILQDLMISVHVIEENKLLYKFILIDIDVWISISENL